MEAQPSPLVARVQALARSHPDHIAVDDVDQQATTWRELQFLVEMLASNLEGVLKRSCILECQTLLHHRVQAPVAILLQRSAQWLATTLAVLQVGFAFVWLCPLELPRDHEAERKRNVEVLRQLRPVALIVQCQGLLQEALPHAGLPEEVVVPPIVKLEELNGTAAFLRPRATRSADLAPGQEVMCFVFTGGTTGNPKCAMIPHRLASHEISAYPCLFSANVSDRVLQQSPCLWPAAPLGQVMIAMAFGCTSLISKQFGESASKLSEELQRRQCTILGAVPSVLAALDPVKLHNCLRVVVSWAEPLDSSTAKAWRAAGIRLFDLLVSTEVWLSLWSSRGGSDEDEFGRAAYSLLKAPTGATAACILVADDDTGLAVATGEIGRLHISGPVFDGYLGESAGDSFVTLHGRRWFRSEDLVRLLPSQAVVFCGRADSLVKLGGKFTDVSAIEAKLRAIPGVGMASCVLDPRLTSCRRAFLALQTTPSLSATAVEKIIREARQILPSGFVLHVTSDIPRKGATGKVDRASLANRAAILERLPTAQREEQHRDVCRLANRHCVVRTALIRYLHFHPHRCACFAYLMLALCLQPRDTPLRSGANATLLNTPLRLQRRIPTVLLVAARDLPMRRLCAITAKALQLLRRPAFPFPRPEAVGAWPTLFWLGVPLWFKEKPWKPLKGTIILWLADKWGVETRVGARGTAGASDGSGIAGSASPDESARKRQRSTDATESGPPRSRQKQAPTAENTEVSSTPPSVNYEGMISFSNYRFETLQPVHELPSEFASPKTPQDAVGNACVAVGRRTTESRLQSCIEEAGITIGPDGGFLSAMDSVRAMRLASSLYHRLGVRLALPALLDCNSCAHVEAAVDKTPAERVAVTPQENGSCCRVWLWYWPMPSPWLLRFQRPEHVDRSILEIALKCLVVRHPAFQMAHESPECQHRFANLAAAALTLGAKAGAWSPEFCTVLGRACFSAWPAMRRISEKWNLCLEVADPVGCRDELLWEVKHREDNFDSKSRTSFLLIPARSLTEGEVRHDHLHVMITHAFADGSSVEPLLNDVCRLYDTAAACNAARNATCGAGSPPELDTIQGSLAPLITDGPQEMEHRLMHSLEDHLKGTLVFAHVCDSACKHFDSWVWPARLRLLVPWIHQAKLAAGMAQATFEAVLLMVLSVAIARAREQAWVPLTLVVSARDGPGDSEHVSMIAEDRNLDLDLANASLLEVLLAVSQGTRQRLWRMPEPLAAHDRVRINVVQLAVPDPHAAFRQVPYSSERGDVRAPYSTNRAGDIYAEELEDGGWELTCKFADCKLPEDPGRQCFCQAVRDVPFELLKNALTPALPVK